MNSKSHTFLCGLAMGAADVVPGVSGGTIAFITGIYPRLLEAIAAFNLDFFKRLLGLRIREAVSLIPWGFLLPLLAGIGTSIFSLARGVTYALAAWPITIWSFFFGLILASIIHLGGQLSLKAVPTWIWLAAGAIAGWLIGGAPTTDIGQTLPVFFVSGFIAICAMILPGISGTFVLVLLGQYSHVIRAVAELNLPILLVFALGCACGIMTFARVVNWLLERWPNAVMAFLTGLMAGSLRTIWPWKADGALVLPHSYDTDVLVGILLCLVGMAVPIVLARVAKRA